MNHFLFQPADWEYGEEHPQEVIWIPFRATNLTEKASVRNFGYNIMTISSLYVLELIPTVTLTELFFLMEKNKICLRFSCFYVSKKYEDSGIHTGLRTGKGKTTLKIRAVYRLAFHIQLDISSASLNVFRHFLI